MRRGIRCCRRGRQDSRAGALRRAQQPSQPDERRVASRRDALERLGCRPRCPARSRGQRHAARAAGTRAHTRRPAAVCRRDRVSGPRGALVRKGRARARAAGDRPADLAYWRRVSSFAAVHAHRRARIVSGRAILRRRCLPCCATARWPALATSPPAPVASPAPVEASGQLPSTRSSGRRTRVRVQTRTVGILPLDIPFPEFGSAIYLAAELTPETQTAELGIEYHRTRGN